MEDLEAKISDSKPDDSSPLKLYFLPFPTPGHMIPQINLAQVFAFRDHNVTILTTPSNAKLIPNHLNVHILNFPSDEVGLPSNIENLSLAKDNHTAYKICKATDLLKSEIESFLHQNPPHALIIDIMCTWRSTLNNSIPTFVYNPMPLFNLCVVEAINRHPRTLASDSSLPYVVPGGLPHNVTLNFNPSSTSFDNMARTLLHAKENNKHGVIVNTFPELEDGYTQYYEKHTGVKVWHLGLVSLMVDYFDKRGKSQENQVDHGCLKWLNTKEPNSVVYICFGSLSRLKKEQNFEIARGIEASGHKFLWVLPKNTKDDDVKEEELLLPHGFEERMREKKRGMIVRGWVPQGLILKHAAIGGFLTHCGANSVAEAICEGVPMITMPRFGDQFLCEKLVTEVLGFGVEVGVCEWSMSPYDARKEVVGWERIENAVRKVMKDEGGSLNKRVKEMKEKAHEAVQEGGTSYNNVTTLVQFLKRMMNVHG